MDLKFQLLGMTDMEKVNLSYLGRFVAFRRRSGHP